MTQQNNQIPQFKVWDNDKKNWIFNCNLTNRLVIDAFNNVYLNHSTKENYDVEHLQNITICRFIGLFDKNNTPIYENDVVEYYYECISNGDKDSIKCRQLVSFKAGKFHPIPDAFDCDDPYYSYEYKDFKVLGNRLENPELLGQSDE